MKKMLCPQCKLHRFRVFNAQGNYVVVTVTAALEIVPIHEEDSLEGFDLNVLHCLGCSWKGSPKSLSTI